MEFLFYLFIYYLHIVIRIRTGIAKESGIRVRIQSKRIRNTVHNTGIF